MHQPNMLVIMTDQHAISTIGAYGSVICKTPHLDALAADSLVFDNAYTICPICTPARASLQTGVYPFRHGMLTNIYTRGCMVHELQDSPSLLSRMLLSRGYQCGYTGKWHLGAGRDASCLGGAEYPELVRTQSASGLPSDVGYAGDDFKGHGGIGEGYPAFAQYLKDKGIEYRLKVLVSDYPKTAEILSDEEGTVPHFLTDRAMAYIDRFLAVDRPFFFMLNHWQPHEPYHVPTRFLDMYRYLELQPWHTYAEDVSDKPFIHHVQRAALLPAWSKTAELLKYYYAAVTQLDDQVGRLVSFLKERGQYDNTLIVFMADHGETLGVHRGLGDKGLNMYEETTRIPLMLKDPEGKRRGLRESSLVQTCDLHATLLEYAGVNRVLAERDKDGKSLLPMLKGENVKWRDLLVSESSGIDNIAHTQRMLRHAQFKFVFHAGGVDELYNLEQDPHEETNLSLQPAYFPLAKEMRLRLFHWMQENGDGFLIRYHHLMEAKNARFSESCRDKT